jgi:hypothetical protein
MAEHSFKTTSGKRQSRLDLAHAASDRADIVRHLLRAEPISPRLALALQILGRLIDDIAALAGDAAEGGQP